MIQTVLNSVPTPNFEYALLSPILIMFFAACLGVLVEAFVSIQKRRFAHLIIVFTSLLFAFFAVALQSGPNGRALVANGTVALDGPGWILQGRTRWTRLDSAGNNFVSCYLECAVIC